MLVNIVTECSLLLILLYVVLIISYIRGFCKVARQSSCSGGKKSVSVIVPFHNESGNIRKTLESILGQETAVGFEVVAVDDHSTDDSRQVVEKIMQADSRLRLVSSTSHGKKSALADGIKSARYDVVATADADCFYPKQWLDAMSATYEKSECMLLAGPVKIGDTSSWFGKFQYADFASLVGSGIGAMGCGHPIMCNGANLMFSKRIFESFDNPYNTEYVSGDDVFLLHRVKSVGGKICFTAQNETIALTSAMPTVRNFMRQRIRWGGKTTGYRDADSLLVAFLVASVSMLICCGLFLLPISAKPLLCAYLPKLFVDTLFLMTICKRLGGRHLLWWMPVFELLVCVYTATVAIVSLVWKKGKRNHNIA